MTKKEETKICKHCMTEIPYNANVCPQCGREQKNIGKWSIAVFAVILILWIFTLGEEDNDTEKNDVEIEKEVFVEQKEEKKKDIEGKEETQEDRKEEFEYGDCKVKYLRHEITENDMGETVLVVYYDFTNNGEDSQCFDYLVSTKAFQNGVEVESSFYHANKESKNGEKDIQKGITLTVADSYVLEENRDNVTIEFRPFNILSDKLLMSLELALE